MRTSLLALSLAVVVLGGGSCPMDPPVLTPPKSVAGRWVGEAFGVKFHFSITGETPPAPYLNFVDLSGSGWLVYGTPAESIAVSVAGFTGGEPAGSVSFGFTTPSGSYGNFCCGGVWQADGTLLGPFSREASEPSPSPWTTRWPAGTQSVSLRLTRQ